MHPGTKRGLGQPHEFRNKPFRSPLRAASHLERTPRRQIDGPQAENGRKTCRSPLVIGSDVAAPTNSTSLPAVGSESASNGPKSLQKHRSALIVRLSQLRQALDTAQQALQIEKSNQDAELQSLIAKWRTIAQQAAEELFADAKERIDSMGGFAAWRRRSEEDALLRTNAEEDDRASHVRGDDLGVLHTKSAVSEAEYQDLGASHGDDDLEENVSRCLCHHLGSLICNPTVLHHGDDAQADEH